MKLNPLIRTLLLFPFLIPLLAIAQTPLPYEIQDDAALLKKKKVEQLVVLTNSESADALDTLEVCRYDEEGRIISRKAWDEYEMIFTTRTYAYGSNGLLAEMQSLGAYGTDVTYYSYSADRLLSEKHTSLDGDYEVAYSYDEEGRIDSSYFVDAEIRRNAWHYNGDEFVDSIIGFTVFDYEKPLKWERVDQQIFEYDKKGRLLFEAFCSTYTGCYTYQYTLKKKRPVLEVVSSNDEEIYRVSTVYEKKLPVVKSILANEEMADRPAEVHRYIYSFRN